MTCLHIYSLGNLTRGITNEIKGSKLIDLLFFNSFDSIYIT